MYLNLIPYQFNFESFKKDIVFQGGLGTYFKLKQFNVTFPGFSYLAIACIIVLIISFALGMGPIPWMVNSELFNDEVKGIANGLTITTSWTMMALVTKTFPTLLEVLGNSGAFYTYGICTGVSIVFVYFFVPETRGKSLQQIQKELSA